MIAFGFFRPDEITNDLIVLLPEEVAMQKFQRSIFAKS
jgi:hypothetical protein